MMSKNGATIEIDMNRINRRYYRAWLDRLNAATTDEENDNLTAEFAEKVITIWPYGEVSQEVYHGLGLVDAKKVDAAILEAMQELNKKK